MGIRDKMKDMADAAEEAAHYDTEVNKGSVRMGSLRNMLNSRWKDGWKLHTIFEQDGNAIMIFEKRS